jgi:methyl-accepting chemotaxis protein
MVPFVGNITVLTSLRIRILLTCACIVTVALAFTSALNYVVVRSYNEDEIYQDLQSVSGGHVVGLDDWIAAKTQALTALQDAALSTDSLPALKTVADACGFTNVYIGYPDKTYRVLHSKGFPTDYDPTIRPWYRLAAVTGKPVVTQPYVAADIGKYVVSFAVPVIRDGSLKAVIGGGFTMDAVNANIKAIHPTRASFGFIVSADGRVVAYPEERLTSKPVSELSASLTEKTLTALAHGGKPIQVNIGGATKILYAHPVKGTDWSLIVALDRSDATAGMRSMVTTSICALLGIVLTAVVIVSGMTARAFRGLSMIRVMMNDIGSGGGDLTRRLPSDGKDEVAQIACSFNAFADKLSAIMSQVRLGSNSVRSAAQEIAAGNTDLSRRTEEQAASLEETASSMEELSGIANQNADNARRANSLALSASNVATCGGEVVAQVVQIMSDIGESSKEINDIINVIESIAFQTNILALNAAVEAARAGGQGRGFAVVAGEVRSLAQRSASAAKEIKALIHDSAARVLMGTDLVAQAGRTMTEIVEAVKQVADIMGEISAASNEQSNGIEQVSKAVNQMDHVTQHNAALVEQAAASADSLKEQARNLNDVVSTFKLSHG